MNGRRARHEPTAQEWVIEIREPNLGGVQTFYRGDFAECKRRALGAQRRGLESTIREVRIE